MPGLFMLGKDPSEEFEIKKKRAELQKEEIRKATNNLKLEDDPDNLLK